MCLCLVDTCWHLVYHVCIVHVDNQFITFRLRYYWHVPCFAPLSKKNVIVHTRQYTLFNMIEKNVFCLKRTNLCEFEEFKKKIMSTWTKGWPSKYHTWTLVDIFLTMYVCLFVHVVCECPLFLWRTLRAQRIFSIVSWFKYMSQSKFYFTLIKVLLMLSLNAWCVDM